jgi:hypothetical protein
VHIGGCKKGLDLIVLLVIFIGVSDVKPLGVLGLEVTETTFAHLQTQFAKYAV